MAIKKKSSGGGGGANWMDTYGDMVTLLLCFFVLLYSMSTISEDNWRAIVMSFNPAAAMAPTDPDFEGNEGPISDPTEDGQGLDVGMAQSKVDAEIQSLYEALKEFVAQEGAQNDISVMEEGGVVYVSFNQAVFFEGEKYAFLPEAYPVLDTISAMLSEVAGSIEEIRVLGHTAQGDPSIPNDPYVDRFLASNRATNVVTYIQVNSTVDPARIISEGYGQWRPVGPNETADERAQNRRVEMIISGRDIAQELKDGVTQYYTFGPEASS